MIKYYTILILFAYGCLSHQPKISQIHQLGTAYYPKMQIEIYSGGTEWGTKALVLTREGLIMRSSALMGEYKIKFIEVNKFSPKQMGYLNSFLKRHNYLKRLKTKYYGELNGFNIPRKYVLRSYKDNHFLSILDKDYLLYQERDYSDRIVMDSLVILMNALIPKKDKDSYSLGDFSEIREVVAPTLPNK